MAADGHSARAPAQWQDALPATADALAEAMHDGRLRGVQLYVARDGSVVADGGAGNDPTGAPLTPGSVVGWWCSTKLVTAMAVTMLADRGSLGFDTPVAEYIDGFERHGKGGVTVRHLLTHTSGIDGDPAADNGARPWQRTPWKATLDQVCDTPLAPGRVPGSRARYSRYTGWFLLATIVAAVDRQPPGAFEEREILSAMGLARSSLGRDDVPPGTPSPANEASPEGT